jgi:hypothetical protein
VTERRFLGETVTVTLTALELEWVLRLIAIADAEMGLSDDPKGKAMLDGLLAKLKAE